MAADQERADRIRQLKADHPEIKWRMVAEHVGVTERAAQEWPKSGGIEPANAKKLAQLFGVSYEWLWFGREIAESNGNGVTPDPFAGPADLRAQLDRIEDKLDDNRRAMNLILLKLGVNLPEAPTAGRVPDRIPDAPETPAAQRRGASA